MCLFTEATHSCGKEYTLGYILLIELLSSPHYNRFPGINNVSLL